jgi:hypothetical protein
MAVGGIAKAVEQMRHVLKYLSALTSELSMVGTDGVEQQQGVPGRGGVQDDERVDQLSPYWSCSSSPSQLPATRLFPDDLVCDLPGPEGAPHASKG